MCEFNDVISDTTLIDVLLKNRDLTWSSKRPCPVFSKLDRFFISAEWSANFPIISSSALEMVVSNHALLLITCTQLQSTPRSFRIELFWMQHIQVHQMISSIWTSDERGSDMFSQETGSDPIVVFMKITRRLHQQLRTWHVSNFGECSKQLNFCKQVNFFFFFLIVLRKNETWTEESFI